MRVEPALSSFVNILSSRLPGWIKAFIPGSALKLEEKAWNAYPYCKTGNLIFMIVAMSINKYILSPLLPPRSFEGKIMYWCTCASLVHHAFSCITTIRVGIYAIFTERMDG